MKEKQTLDINFSTKSSIRDQLFSPCHRILPELSRANTRSTGVSHKAAKCSIIILNKCV